LRNQSLEPILALLACSTQKRAAHQEVRGLSCLEKACFKNMISYRLRNGKEGNIDDPQALLVFYTRVFYEDKIKEEATGKRQWARRRKAQQRTPTQD
jgi:hypothetical protein